MLDEEYIMKPEELRYTREHLWAAIEGDNAGFGIIDHAQKELEDIVYVELPGEGWIFTLRIKNREEINDLLDYAAYLKFIES